MDLLLTLLLNAAILGAVITVMEAGDFPGWGPLIGCALAVGLANGVVSHFLPGVLSLLGIVAGALVGALMISWLTDMPFRRAVKAVGIYLGLSFVFWMLMGGLAG